MLAQVRAVPQSSDSEVKVLSARGIQSGEESTLSRRVTSHFSPPPQSSSLVRASAIMAVDYGAYPPTCWFIPLVMIGKWQRASRMSRVNFCNHDH